MSANQPPENTDPQVPGSQPQGRPADYQSSEQQFGPDGQPLQSGAQMGLEGRPLSGGAPQYGPDGQPLNTPQYGPDVQPLNTPQYGPDGQPLQPGGAPQYGQGGQPIPPGAYPPAGGAFQPPMAEASKKGGTLKRILTSVGVAILVIVGGILWRSGVFDRP